MKRGQQQFMEDMVRATVSFTDRDSIGGDDLTRATRDAMLRIAFELLDYVGDHPAVDEPTGDRIDTHLINDVIEYGLSHG